MSRACPSLAFRIVLGAFICVEPGCVAAAYRVTLADPQVQSITDIPLSGYNAPSPEASVGTARRAAPAFDGAASGAIYLLSQSVFTPDATTATSLTVAPGAGPRFREGDLLRVGRTGEMIRVVGVNGDVLTVQRAWFGSIGAPLLNDEALTIVNRNTSFVCWYFCEQPDMNTSATIWELDRRSMSAATFALSLVRAPNLWRIGATILGAPPLCVDLPFDPRGHWLLISVAHVNEPSTGADSVLLTTYDSASGVTIVSEPAAFTLTASISLVPDIATIGDRYANPSSPARNARGICIPAIVADAVVDGRTLASGVNTRAAAAVALDSGLSGHVTGYRFGTCVWATNYSGGALGGPSNDARAGIVDGALHVFDANRAFGPSRHQFGSGATLRGGLVSVDPYTFGEPGFVVARPAFDDAVSSVAFPATSETVAELGGLNPSGRAGARTQQLADALIDGVVRGKLRVGVFGNSRAVYPQSYPLRLSDGRFPGRLIKTNFVDAGILGQAPVYDSGLVVGHIGPVPWCNWSDVDLKTGEYGADCSAELPRCVANTDTAPTLVAPSVAMTSLVNSTLGSRFGVFSPTATRVPSVGYPGSELAGSLDNYRGAHASVRLKPGNSVRFMVRPEIGLPTNDPLVVTLYLQNHPSSSTVRARAVSSMSQAGAEIWSQALSPPGLGPASDLPPVPSKPIIDVVAPVLRTQALQDRYGSITVNDSDGAFGSIEVGDLVQISDSSGVSSVYNEAFAAFDLTRTSDGNLRIAYQWLPRQFPMPGDRVTFIKGGEILKKVQVEIPPVASGVWRGVEVVADRNGDGVLLWGFGFENPARDGLITMPLGRSGCGAWIQYLRWPMVPIEGGRSLLGRVLEELDLDVFILTTADQGTPGGDHVTAYDWVIDRVKDESPQTEIVVYATGPEYMSEDILDKSDAYDKFSQFAAMQLVAASHGLPLTSFFCDAEIRSSAFGRVESGTDTTESATHPGTVRDITSLARQIASLAPVPPLVEPPHLTVCPLGEATFTVEDSPPPGTTFCWELEDAYSLTGYSALTDGPVVRENAKIAEVRGSSTNSISLTRLSAWRAGRWARGDIASLRCIEKRPALEVVSSPATLGSCTSDFDCSQGTDGDDVLVFMGLWDIGDAAADVTGDGGVDGDDVIYFFARWDAGC